MNPRLFKTWLSVAGAWLVADAGPVRGAPAASNEPSQPVFQDPPAAAAPAAAPAAPAPGV